MSESRTPDRWREIEALYHAAHSCSPERRSELLAQAEPDVRREVESLLAERSREGPLDGFAVDLLQSADGETPDPATAAETSSCLGPGLTFGPYLVLSTLGRGGMGVVYRGRDTKLDRDVAIKVLPAAFASDPQRLARFQLEAKTLAALNHPNIAAIYGLEERDGTTALVLELVEGPTLADRLAQGPCSLTDTLAIATQIAEALRAAHERGVIHRDLKPANITLRPDGTVKVLDFGLAKRPSRVDVDDLATEDIIGPGLTRHGVVLGTVGYMSPEQAAGRPADFATDQFSFGVILFELLAGQRPFAGDTSVETLSAIIRDDPPPIGTLNPDVPWPLERIVQRCLAKDPRERYSDTRQIVDELRDIRDRVGRVTRRRAVWYAAAVILATASAGAVWRLMPADTGVRTLAVLPFTNAASDPDIDYLSDGITETLTQRISHLPSLKVMASSAVLRFKEKPIDPRQAGGQLGVDAILTGTVSERDGRLRITAELVEVATGLRLWGNSYDRTPVEVLSVQDEIATAIIDRLRLSGSEGRALARPPTDDPEAYEWYLRARHATLRGTEDDLLQALDLLTSAVKRDPSFALAHKTLATTYIALAVDGFARPTEAFPEAKRNVNLASVIDPQLAGAHEALAAIAFFFDWDWATAEREWAIAKALPTFALPTQEVAGRSLTRWVLAGPAEALREVRELRALDPLTVSYSVMEADYLFHAGQLDEAATLYQKTLEAEPTAAASALFGLAEVRAAQGRFDEALDVRRRAHASGGDDSLLDLFESARGEKGYRLIERTAVEHELEVLRARAASAYVSPLDMARAHARLGDRQQAFRYLGEAFEERSPGLVFLKVDLAWNPIRDDPRFAEAVRRVRLP